MAARRAQGLNPVLSLAAAVVRLREGAGLADTLEGGEAKEGQEAAIEAVEALPAASAAACSTCMQWEKVQWICWHRWSWVQSLTPCGDAHDPPGCLPIQESTT